MIILNNNKKKNNLFFCKSQMNIHFHTVQYKVEKPKFTCSIFRILFLTLLGETLYNSNV